LVALLPAEHIGLAVALLTSVIAFVHFGTALVVARRRLGPIDGRQLLWRHLQYLAAGLVSAPDVFDILLLLCGYRPDGFALSSFASAIVAIIAVGAVMAPVYVGVLALMRNPELKTLVDTIRSRFGRGNPE